MGFDPDLRLYHGTSKAFSAFDPSKGGTMTGVAPARLGIWTSPDPEMAAEFAAMAHKKMGGAPQVYPLVHRMKKRGGWTLRGDETNDEVAGSLAQAWDDGFDAVMLRNITLPSGRAGSFVVIKDPAQLRSPFAQFDPKKRNSANLLAGGAGATVLGPTLTNVLDDQQ